MTIGSLAYDTDLGIVRQNASQTLADDSMVIDEKHRDRHCFRIPSL
jgi:hypothetical protein